MLACRAKLRTHARHLCTVPKWKWLRVSLLASKSLIFLKLIKSWWGQAMVSSNPRIRKAPITTVILGVIIFLAFWEELSTLTEGIAKGYCTKSGERITESNEDKTIGLKRVGVIIIKANGFYQEKSLLVKVRD